MNEDKESSKEQKFSHSKKQKDKGNPTHKKRVLQSSFACKIQDLEDTKGRNATALEIEALSTLQPCTSVVQDKQIPSDTCHGNWSCCGSNCYYFSKEEKSWDESKESCEAIGSLLSKIDDEDEQRYIEQRIQYNYWVGLRTKGIAHPWLWLDGARLSHRLKFEQTTADAKCGFIMSTNIAPAACNKLFPYICEKNLDNEKKLL